MKVFYFLIVSAFSLAVSCAGATAKAPTADASGKTIFDYISDHTLTGTTKAGKTFHQFYQFDGVAFIEVPTPAGFVIRDKGKWWIKGDQLCRQWTRVFAGREMCTPMRFDGSHVEIIGSGATLAGTLSPGDTQNLSAIGQPGTMGLPPGKPTLVYISAKDCEYCILWDNTELPKFRASPASKAVIFREVRTFTFSNIKDEEAWPKDLMWLHDAMKGSSGTPRWFLVVAHRVIAHAYGLSGWSRTMVPALDRIASQRHVQGVAHSS